MNAAGSILVRSLTACLIVLSAPCLTPAWADTRTPLPPTAVYGAASPQPVWPVVDTLGQPLSPTALAILAGDLYLLEPRALYCVKDGAALLARPQKLEAVRVGPPAACVGGVPVHEFSTFAACPDTGSLVILDKAGDLFRYATRGRQWSLLRAMRPAGSLPDPDYVDLSWQGRQVCLLDPERNQIWCLAASGGVPAGLFKEVLPWRAKPGDPYVADAVSMACSGAEIYVLKRSGTIVKYFLNGDQVTEKLVCWRRPRTVRPARLATAPGAPLYVVERENNRVIAVDKKSCLWRPYVFPPDSDLRAVMPAQGGFYVINGHSLTYRRLDKADPAPAVVSPRRIDERLDGMILPISGVRLPRHPGVWPGARRLYRFGVHKGVDFFNDTGCSARVVMGTPVRAADGGKVVRADVNFRDMDAGQFRRVMRQCLLEHDTSERNEDLFRGCQVWIDHGRGVVTRYAHLQRTAGGIKAGSYVARGEVIGYVGVSGTGQHLAGKVKHPHLHFEIWMDGNYLGWGLTAGETIGLFEDIFGTGCERGSS